MTRDFVSNYWWLLFSLVAVLFVSPTAFSNESLPIVQKQNSAFMPNLTLVREEVMLNSHFSRKLSPNVKLRLSELSTEANSIVSVIVRTSSNLESERRSQLETIGAHIHTVAGDIVTISIPLRQICQLAEFDFVSYIELSTPLYPESEN